MANGIPALFGQVAKVTNTASLLTSDAASVLKLLSGPQWGIGLNGVMQIVPDSILSLEAKRDWQVPNYPQEEGSFASYNKVQMPYDARVQMTKGGSDAVRSAFLSDVMAMAESLELFDIVTPMKVYRSVNVTHVDYRQTATSGIGLLTLELWFEEIRVTGSVAFSNTQQPSGAATVSNGTVQPQAATGAQTAALAALL
ncbi:phage baseplate protein [Robbsia sp. KACC 23696]|uniref:phage baseplate protein n=1 Tax=Robbsia sp. KACC 23696 TaxID=3149231 RepID=UPI00325AC7FC